VDAISDDKQMVRGEEKWYVDFDKCVPYFTETAGCGICIEVCPWSKPDRGFSLSKKLLEKRAKKLNKEKYINI
jgi:epoxyqueuosine reductase QueG